MTKGLALFWCNYDDGCSAAGQNCLIVSFLWWQENCLKGSFYNYHSCVITGYLKMEFFSLIRVFMRYCLNFLIEKGHETENWFGMFRGKRVFEVFTTLGLNRTRIKLSFPKNLV